MPKPKQQPHPPIWQVVDGARSIEWAAQNGLNTIMWIPTVKALKKNEEVVETLEERIVGRTSLNDVFNPLTEELLVAAGDHIFEVEAKKIQLSPLEAVDVRSPLTCEAKTGICAKCYGRNLATGKMVQRGEAVGVVAAQSIGEPGTQLTLRTFHVGGVAGNISEENKLIAKFEGTVKIEDLRTVSGKDNDGNATDIVISRTAEIKIINKTRVPDKPCLLYTSPSPRD